MIDKQRNIEEFESLYNKYILPRDGGDKLLDFIRKSDFYTAPASTRFHLSEEGGLLQHSLNVYHCLMAKSANPTWADLIASKEETLAVIALLHDLCKTFTYKKEFKNQKVYDTDKVASAPDWKVKSDSKGKFIWDEVKTYVTDNQYPLGHGSKSIFFIQNYIKLTEEEIACIYWHMGAYNLDSSQYNELGSAIEKFPLVLALQEADMESSHILEVNQ